MLSALEAAYNWEDDVQLLVIKDLNSGHVHWAVQAVAPAPATTAPPEEEDEEDKVEIPRAFSRNVGEPGPELGGPLDGVAGAGDGEVLPFLLRNLDTGEQLVIDDAWSQYTDDMSKRAKATSGPAQARPSSSPERMPAVSPQSSETSQPQPEPSAGGGSFWMQRVQSRAVSRLQG